MLNHFQHPFVVYLMQDGHYRTLALGYGEIENAAVVSVVQGFGGCC